MMKSLSRLIDRVIAWLDRLAAPQPQLIPIPVRAGEGRKTSKPHGR